MVLQDVSHQLFTESVLDDILLSMRTEDKQKAREILKEMDLLSFEDCHPMGLSGGQKQRVAVASAIASELSLIHISQDAPLLYAELALKADGLQRYVDAMNEFN